MLPFLEELLEKKLSDALGADVSFDGVKLSPLTGRVEVLNLAAKTRGKAEAFLTIPRIEAKIAMARALKQEISIQSLRIERPTVRLPLPLPRKVPANPKAAGTTPPKPWQFEADDVLVVDAKIEFQTTAYHAVAERLNLSLARESLGIVVTVVCEMLRRLDPDVPVGALKFTGRIATQDFSRTLNSPLSIEGTIDPQLRVVATTTALESKTIDARVSGQIDSELFSRLVPVPIPTIAGVIHLDIDGTFSPNKITLRRGEISTANATVELSLP